MSAGRYFPPKAHSRRQAFGSRLFYCCHHSPASLDRLARVLTARLKGKLHTGHSPFQGFKRPRSRLTLFFARDSPRRSPGRRRARLLCELLSAHWREVLWDLLFSSRGRVFFVLSWWPKGGARPVTVNSGKIVIRMCFSGGACEGRALASASKCVSGQSGQGTLRFPARAGNLNLATCDILPTLQTSSYGRAALQLCFPLAS